MKTKYDAKKCDGGMAAVRRSRSGFPSGSDFLGRLLSLVKFPRAGAGSGRYPVGPALRASPLPLYTRTVSYEREKDRTHGRQLPSPCPQRTGRKGLAGDQAAFRRGPADRKSGGVGKSGSVRVDLGGRRCVKKKKKSIQGVKSGK